MLLVRFEHMVHAKVHGNAEGDGQGEPGKNLQRKKMPGSKTPHGHEDEQGAQGDDALGKEGEISVGEGVDAIHGPEGHQGPRPVDQRLPDGPLGQGIQHQTHQRQQQQNDCVLQQKGQQEEENESDQQDHDDGGESFPEQHKQKGKINQGGPQVGLQQDQRRRQKDDHARLKQVVQSAKLKVVGGKQPGQGQGGHRFGKFRRLQLESGQNEPAFGTVDLPSEQQDGKQQEGKKSIQNVGKMEIELGVQDQEEDGQQQGRSDPEYLLSEALRQVEHAGAGFHDVGRINVHPPKRKQDKPDENAGPVEIGHDVVPLYHSILLFPFLPNPFPQSGCCRSVSGPEPVAAAA
ncbi:MAG: hypothetical protein R2751_10680 [Bacteroidales bacterium]